jgi:DNA-binding response OmpR family regulator
MILLVEPDPRVAAAISSLLVKDGHSVSRATRLQEAHDLCQDGRFDLLIASNHLPDGAACELLTDAHSCRTLPGILVTSDPDSTLCMTAEGFRARLTPPIHLPALRSAILRACA